jgi:hypothetical protein
MTAGRLCFVPVLVVMMCISAVAFGQAQAIIIPMATAIARGLVGGMAESAGREIYENMRNSQDGETTAGTQRPGAPAPAIRCDTVFAPPAREAFFCTSSTPEQRRACAQEADEIYNRQVTLKRQEWDRQQLQCRAQLGREAAPPTSQLRPPSEANRLTWRMLNSHGEEIALLFYPINRQPPPPKFNAYPGDNRIFVLPPGQPQRITLNCKQGEKICYGAWQGSTYWGVGYAKRYPCNNCCRVCGSAEAQVSGCIERL